MAEATLYEIKLRYQMEGDAAGKLDMLAAKADRAGSAAEGLKSALREVGLAIGAGFLIEKGKEALIGFNSEMERLKISLGAVIQMNLGGTFAEATRSAEGLFGEFQKFAVTSPLTTKEIAEFGQNISAAVFTHGGSMKDFIQITEQGAIAAQVFGVNAQFAGVEMQHLLAGDISSRMRFINQLMSPLLARKGLSKEQFKAMDEGARLNLVKEALNDPGLQSAAKNFEKSFTGVTSTFKDNIQIALGKIGLPLFKAITNEVAGWNEWLQKNEHTLELWGHKLSSALVSGFTLVKQVFTTIIEHKDLILSLAGGFLALKGVGAVGGFFGNLTSGAQALASDFGSLSSKISGAGGVIAGLVGFYMALETAATLIDKHQKKTIENEGNLGNIRAIQKRLEESEEYRHPEKFMRNAEKFAFLNQIKELGAFTTTATPTMVGLLKEATFNREKFGQELAARGANADEIAKLSAVADAVFLNMSQAKLFDFLGGAQHTFADDLNKRGPVKSDRNINVRIDKIEVASDDPDRFAFDLVKSFETVAKAPTTAESVFRGM